MTDAHIFLIDTLTTRDSQQRAEQIASLPRCTITRGDIRDKSLLYALFARHCFDQVIHFANKRRIHTVGDNPESFIDTNIQGTQTILEVAANQWFGRYADAQFIYVSTEQVYGELHHGAPPFSETDRLLPSCPYAASKASAELMAQSYHRAFGFPTRIVRPSTVYGPAQGGAHFIPRVIRHGLQSTPITLHEAPETLRQWLWVEDFCRGVYTVSRNGKSGEIYNIGGHHEYSHHDIVGEICQQLNKPLSEAITLKEDLLAHHQRRALSTAKLRDLGWSPQISIEHGLSRCIQWYTTHRSWWDSSYEIA
ncbi:dTDP-glucose 4,6-dehydratase [Chitinivibrio alkaliphilus ACht1]|uniref:dTDP-glucose 4,6-dehydratase n=2 Tax=Chitinivibrio TaxID=1505231 RepID=U7D9R7_9BACT|nr:dTDP-glucose 4,6-dehydratase [Chitinivibrio alkaliphilus ACht1]